MYINRAQKTNNFSEWGARENASNERDMSSLCATGKGSGHMGKLSGDCRRRCRHLEIQVDILAGELYFLDAFSRAPHSEKVFVFWARFMYISVH